MLRAWRIVIVALTALAICLLPLTPTLQAAPTSQDAAGDFERLLGFVSAPTTLEELTGVWINYADPGAVKRVHGYDFTSYQGMPPLVAPDATDLTPEQHRAQRWLWDRRTMDFPNAAGFQSVDRWADVFGYDGFAVERSLEYGQPVKDYGVLELSIDTNGIADKLTGLGYTSGAAPHGYSGTLYQRLGDYDQDLTSDAGSPHQPRSRLPGPWHVAGQLASSCH
jgi:hypothetical protein